MADLFISYRRQDAAPYAGRIQDRLVARFGAERVFMDTEDLRPGEDFQRAIAQRIRASGAVLAVIGPRWLEASDGTGRRRLDDPVDVLRRELAAALEQGVRVVPLLVGGATMPPAARLPEDLAALARCHAIGIRDASFDEDVAALMEALERELPSLASWRRRRTLARAGLPAALVAAVAAIAWHLAKPPPEQPTTASAPAASLSGEWEADVTYGWGVRQTERFRLEHKGGEVLGSAGFLGVPRTITEGRAANGVIRFSAQFEEGFDAPRRVTLRYLGTARGSDIDFVLSFEGGSQPRPSVTFVARRAAAGADAASRGVNGAARGGSGG